ncbi:hypothetical protein ACFTRD_15090 [Paenibacillus sp. NPDC056933]|uniref:hypothetical protein n=1 Tax=Paenibacillus sp. NPDC056933 TaxID=3345968 RepID=UPI00362D6283
MTPITFEGQHSKEVGPGETFSSDEATLELKEGYDLVFSWTLSALEPGKSFPYNVEGMLAAGFDGPGHLAGEPGAERLTRSDKLLVLPSFIGYFRPAAKRMVLLGDSITQGVRTEQNAYAY